MANEVEQLLKEMRELADRFVLSDTLSRDASIMLRKAADAIAWQRDMFMRVGDHEQAFELIQQCPEVYDNELAARLGGKGE